MLQSILPQVVSVPQVLSRLSGEPTPQQVKQLQVAASVLGLAVAVWEFDGPDGRPGNGGYALVELVRPGDMMSVATLWETPEWPAA